jgi:hypothetical protein
MTKRKISSLVLKNKDGIFDVYHSFMLKCKTNIDNLLSAAIIIVVVIIIPALQGGG